MKFVFGSVKFVSFITVLLLFMLHHTIISLVIFNEKVRLRYFLKSIQLTSKIGLRILNVRTIHEGVRGEVKNKLIVANHLSYLDVLVLFSKYPSLFITSTEIRDTFLLGRICRLAGCFFVERRKDRHTPSTKNLEMDLMKDHLNAGFNVFLFPEGTSSDGKKVLPFKGTFFQLATEASIPVQPLCLKYTSHNRDLVPWYGDMTFPDHLFKLCLQNKISATVAMLPEMEIAPKMELASKAHSIISEAYGQN